MKNVEIIGIGCPFCRKLHQSACEAVEEDGIEAEVKYSTGLAKTLPYVPHTPVLLVDGQVVHRGKKLPDKKKIAELIEKAPS